MANHGPELGQMVFHPEKSAGNFVLGYVLYAVLDFALQEIGRVYGNVNQCRWEFLSDPGIPGLEIRPFYWGEDEYEASRPNLSWGGIDWRWYKHPGRGVSIDQDIDANELSAWLERFMDHLNGWDHEVREQRYAARRAEPEQDAAPSDDEGVVTNPFAALAARGQ